VGSYYRLIKTIESDPEFDTKRAKKKLRSYVEGHQHAIRLKAEIMVDHFHEQVLALNKIGGKARAMVVTGSIERAIQYYHAICQHLTERKSPWRAIVAFSGEHEYGGAKVTEASLNGFPSNARFPSVSRRTRTGSWSAPTNSRPATMSPCCTRCTWTSRSPA
jgi:type I restriction enzyme R subunit